MCMCACCPLYLQKESTISREKSDCYFFFFFFYARRHREVESNLSIMFLSNGETWRSVKFNLQPMSSVFLLSVDLNISQTRSISIRSANSVWENRSGTILRSWSQVETTNVMEVNRSKRTAPCKLPSIKLEPYVR